MKFALFAAAAALVATTNAVELEAESLRLGHRGGHHGVIGLGHRSILGHRGHRGHHGLGHHGYRAGHHGASLRGLGHRGHRGHHGYGGLRGGYRW